jgi:hypothetical protein
VDVSSGEDDVIKKSTGDDVGDGEPLQLRRSLLTRSGLMHWDNSILPSLIGLLQPLLLWVDAGESIPRPFPSGNEHFLH